MMLVAPIVRSVTAEPPMVTEVAPVKSVPVMVTAVPPAVGPAVGLIAVTVGTAAYALTGETKHINIIKRSCVIFNLFIFVSLDIKTSCNYA